MAFCTNCGKQIAEGARFCPFCGTAVEVPAAPAVQETPAVPEAPAAPISVPQEIPPYAAPQPSQYAAPQPSQYAAPPQPQYAAPPQPQYAVPPQPQYAAPPQSPYAAAPGGYYPPPYSPMGAVPAKKGGALKVILPIAAALAVAAVVLILALGGGSGYKKAVQKLLDVECGDFSDLEDLVPEGAWQSMAEEEGYSNVKDYQKYIREEFEEYWDEDRNLSYSFDIIEDKKLSEEELVRISLSLQDRYPHLDPDSFSELRLLKISATAYMDGETDTEEVYMGAVKIDGDWYILRADDGEVLARFLFFLSF